jgi:hypothetical protein
MGGGPLWTLGRPPRAIICEVAKNEGVLEEDLALGFGTEPLSCNKGRSLREDSARIVERGRAGSTKANLIFNIAFIIWIVDEAPDRRGNKSALHEAVRIHRRLP